MQKHQHATESKFSDFSSGLFAKTGKALKALCKNTASGLRSLFAKCGRGFKAIGAWFRKHFGADVAAVKGFSAKLRSADNKAVRSVKNYFSSAKAGFKKFFRAVGGFFSKESRARVIGAIKNKFKAVGDRVEERGFLAWAANSVKLHTRFLGTVAMIVSIVIFSAVYAANAYAMNSVAVIVNGENIGTVANIQEFDESVRLVEERVSLGTNGEYKLGFDIKYEFTSSSADEISTTYEMIDKILRFSGTNIVAAYGLYVDGELWAVCREKETIDGVFETILAPYQKRQTEAGATVAFTQKTETVYGLYPAGLLCSEEDLKSIIGDVEGYKSYRVQADDTLENIAMMNDTTVEAIKELNPDLPEELVAGSDINVAKNETKLSVKTVIRKTYQKTIKYKTTKTRTKELAAGTTKVSQKGENGLKEITSDFVYIDGELSEEIIVESKTLKKAVDEKILVGTKAVGGGGGGVSTGNYMRPVSGGYVSSKYGYRGREFHTGVDIACPKGTPIMAADGGTVTSVVYGSTGYGYHIIINHSNGEQTLYAHCSALYVSVGQKVDKGDVIAAVGQTGRAYGYHLHFEVRRNGKHVYPGIG
ncbi:MAG: peptidoglycan DD-metalloendopeptidase family protein [Clostridia bacterium]|nr:peptidoglycan DD-metalloendopeptidase family protein [Clostridia bacterium]